MGQVFRPVAASFRSPLVVFFVSNALAIEAFRLQDRPHVIHHGLQTADEDIDIATAAQSFVQMRLYVPRAALPSRAGAAQGWPIPEVRMIPRQLLEFVAIEQTALVADAVNQRELMDIVTREPIVQHRAERGDACPARDQNRVFNRLAENESSIWAGHLQFISGLEIEQVGGEMPFDNKVQAEIETPARRRRGHRVGASDRRSLDIGGAGYKLTGYVTKILGRLEDEMTHAGRDLTGFQKLRLHRRPHKKSSRRPSRDRSGPVSSRGHHRAEG